MRSADDCETSHSSPRCDAARKPSYAPCRTSQQILRYAQGGSRIETGDLNYHFVTTPAGVADSPRLTDARHRLSIVDCQ
jgi:hypothetical protein